MHSLVDLRRVVHSSNEILSAILAREDFCNSDGSTSFSAHVSCWWDTLVFMLFVYRVTGVNAATDAACIRFSK